MRIICVLLQNNVMSAPELSYQAFHFLARVPDMASWPISFTVVQCHDELAHAVSIKAAALALLLIPRSGATSAFHSAEYLMQRFSHFLPSGLGPVLVPNTLRST